LRERFEFHLQETKKATTTLITGCCAARKL
jgi:hypothetical protein